MRERQQLEHGDRPAYERLERELDDARRADRARRGRGRRGHRRRSRGGAARARRARPSGARSRRCCRARPTATTPISRSMPAPAAPRARTGPRCCCACTRAGPSSTATRSSCSREHAGEEAGIKSATLQVKGDERLWLAEDRSRACTGWCASRPTTATRAGTPPSPASGSIRWSTTPSRSRSTRSDVPHRHLPLLRRRRPARQHHRLGGAHHASCRPASRSPCQQERSQHKNRAIAWEMLQRAPLRAGAEEARGRGQRRPPPPRPRSAGATRSAPTCCSPTSW